ncbi:ABC transporter substrate-binding protein [Nocardia callitridis]|uniref:ABC transporter substrate-binding protein n=1 Tax=Nocardia callitridis TaxID=648753 RepID=A0ABP9K745_9NOCA
MRPIKSAIAAVLAGGLALTVVACGSDDEPSSSTATAATVIKHNRGETSIDGVPERIVALGNQWLDAVQSLGVTPVAYIDTVAAVAGGTPEWEPATLQQAKPLDPQGDVVEQIAAQNPDLILVPDYLADQATFDKLAKFAPTVGSLTSAGVDPWRDQVSALGKILHKQDEAAKVVGDIDAEITAAAARHPALQGKTFTSTFLFTSTQLVVSNDPKDGSTELFSRLGLTIPQSLVDQRGAMGRLTLSPERIGDLTADLLVVTATPDLQEAFKRLPGYDNLPAVRADSIAFVDMAAGSGINQPTPLNVPYLLDKLEPTFAAAAK